MSKVDYNKFSEIVDKYYNDDLGFGKYKHIAVDLLSSTVSILEEFNINYCLISGTLLGKIRHNDFIPWDDDIDLLVHDTLIHKLDQIIQKYNEKFTFIGGSGCQKICFANRGLEINTDNHGCKKNILNKGNRYNWPFIDLFTYNIDNNKIKFFNKDWELDNFLPFIKTDFVGLTVNIPNNSDYFLKINFRDDYMTRLVSNWYIHKNETVVDLKDITQINIHGYNYIKENEKK
jgi:phosphorylcholine metabolism protein LicD